jgi:hypothetical protein
MVNKNQEFFKLLKCSNKLRKNNKSLFKENPEKSRKLSRFLIIIEENLHLRQKDKYIELMQIFLNNNIDAEDFSFCFIAKYDNINQTLREMKQDFEKKFDELSNLLIENKNKKYQIGMSLMSLMSMYDHCDDFNPNSNSSMIDEENLRNYAIILLSELKRA